MCARPIVAVGGIDLWLAHAKAGEPKRAAGLISLLARAASAAFPIDYETRTRRNVVNRRSPDPCDAPSGIQLDDIGAMGR